MKRQISLKLYVSMIFLSLTAFLVVGFALLSARYYMMGMDSITASDMMEAAKSYQRSIPHTARHKTDRFSGYLLSTSWQNLPPAIRNLSETGPDRPGELIKIDNSGLFRPPELITFALLYKEDNEQFFVVKQMTRHSAPAIVGKNAKESLDALLLITVSIALTLAFITWLTLRQVSLPVSALGKWARNLDAGNLKKSPPDFNYPELNELAELIRTSLSSVHESLEREQNFLRHASHELRTPISVIRNNVELMHKLQEQPASLTFEKQQHVIERIDRASLTMKHMTETLLWLSRDDIEILSTRLVSIDGLISELVDELRYLTAGKEIQLTIATSPCTAEVPETVARIVLSNLIRNAFQHTVQGSVDIRQENRRITLVNTPSSPLPTNDDLGFGLGVKLTKQLTEKMNWPYTYEHSPSGYRTSVTLSDRQLFGIKPPATT